MSNQPRLNKKDAELIRRMHRAGWRVCELSDIFDVHHSNISRIISRKAYA